MRYAAEKSGVPNSTLHDRVSGKVQHGTISGPDPYLTVEKEEELASFLIKCVSIIPGFSDPLSCDSHACVY